MSVVAGVLVALVALLHLLFLVLEMFLWDKPAGMKVFALEPAHARATRAMAANQGLYNGFLAAGLVWGLVSGEQDLRLFFLACVVVAGVFGAVTVSPKIAVVQALPALVATGAVLAA